MTLAEIRQRRSMPLALHIPRRCTAHPPSLHQCRPHMRLARPHEPDARLDLTLAQRPKPPQPFPPPPFRRYACSPPPQPTRSLVYERDSRRPLLLLLLFDLAIRLSVPQTLREPLPTRLPYPLFLQYAHPPPLLPRSPWLICLLQAGPSPRRDHDRRREPGRDA